MLNLSEVAEVASSVTVRPAKLGRIVGDADSDQQAEFLHALALTLYTIPTQIEYIRDVARSKYAKQHRDRIAVVLRNLADAFEVD